MQKKKQLAILLVGSFFSYKAFALPDGLNVVSGSVSATQTTNQLSITNSPNAIIDWNSFSINAGETTQFIQNSSNSSVLNRVIGNNLSNIYGNLTSNGKVYLINPNGIFVGPTGQINTAAFFASTHNLSNEDFLSGGNLLFTENNSGTIVNLGKISATDSDVFLIANEVRNEGEISAKNGTVGLVAAGQSDVLLADGADRRVIIKTNNNTQVSEEGVVNEGTIAAAKIELAAAGGNVYALAINNNGKLRATTLKKEGGRILLLSDKGNIKLSATSDIDASGELGGGEINIGGSQQGLGPLPNAKNLTTEAGSIVKADANQSGDGGKVILYSDNSTTVASKISARGGSESGNGGFIEVSGKQTWQYDNWLQSVGVSAPNGIAGTFLIDPNDININDASATGTVSGSPVNANTLADADIENFLNNIGNLIVTTTGTGGSGDINVNSGASIAWGGTNSLTLDADRRIFINDAAISSNGSGDLTLDAQSSVTSNGGSSIQITDSTITTNEGDINIVGALRGDVAYRSGVELNNSTIRSVGSGSDAGTITIAGTGSALSGGFGKGYANRGVHIHTSSVVTSVDGDIQITGTGPSNSDTNNQGVIINNSNVTSTGLGTDAATITITGTSRNRRAPVAADTAFPSWYSNYLSSIGRLSQGVLLEGNVSSVNGDVSITGTSASSLATNTTNAGIEITNGNINLTGDANLTLQGTSPTTNDFYVTGTSVIGGPNALGDITIIGNEFTVAAPGTTIQSRGDLSISSNTNSSSIGLGSGAGTLSIDAAEFATFSDGFNSISIGDAAAGTGTVNIGTLAISDEVNVFGGTVNATGPVTPIGGGGAITPTTGTVGAVNFASYADPTANPVVPAAPTPTPVATTSTGNTTPTPVATTSTGNTTPTPVATTSTGNITPTQQTAINETNTVLNETYLPPIISSDSGISKKLQGVLQAAASRAQLLQEQKAVSANYLAKAREARERKIASDKARYEYALAALEREEQAKRDGTYVKPDYFAVWGTRTLLGALRQADIDAKKKEQQLALKRKQEEENRKKEAQRIADEEATLKAKLIAEERQRKIEEWEREREIIARYEAQERAIRLKAWKLELKEKAKKKAEQRKILLAKRAEQHRAWFISSSLKDAKKALSRQRFTSPERGNALDIYKNILRLDPNNKAALEGLELVAEGLSKRIGFYIGIRRFDEARKLIANANDKLGETKAITNINNKLNQRIAERQKQKDDAIAANKAWKLKRAEEEAERERFWKAKYDAEQQRRKDEEIARLKKIEADALALAKKEATEKMLRLERQKRADEYQAWLDSLVRQRKAREAARKAYYEEYERKRLERNRLADEAWDKNQELIGLRNRLKNSITAFWMTPADKARLASLEAESKTEGFKRAFSYFQRSDNPKYQEYIRKVRSENANRKPKELTAGQKWAQRNAERARAAQKNRDAGKWVTDKIGYTAAKEYAQDTVVDTNNSLVGRGYGNPGKFSLTDGINKGLGVYSDNLSYSAYVFGGNSAVVEGSKEKMGLKIQDVSVE